jgi:Ca2+-binding EF-hand superfamily protein
MQTNYSSNFKSNNLDNYEIPKNDINEKKNLLFKLWVNFIEKEKEIEKIKQSLSSCQEANPQNIFSLFNKSNSNLIKSSDILETLNSLSQNDTFEQNDIKYIFKKYNKTTTNGFTNNEFNKIIFSQQIPENNDEVELEENTKNIILELFKEIIEGEKSIENSRILIEKSANNIFFDLFESIKKENKSGIEKDDIDKFMKDNEYDITNDDIDIIMEKMDKNHDGIIDYGEFIAEIRPMNFC